MAKTKRQKFVGPIIDTEPLRAYLRIRPLTKAETVRAHRFADSDVYSLMDRDTVTVTPPQSSAYHRSGIGNEIFKFTTVFSPEADQAKVFAESMSDPLRLILSRGFNLLMFAYGVTSSGKSYTMMGTSQHPGIIPRFVKCVFGKVTQSFPIKCRGNERFGLI
ncbi:hypothetical protein ACOME3_003049 [Neoechinorhynchus agilis]